MKDILWMLFVIIQYFRATLLLLTVITGKKQVFWNSNEMQSIIHQTDSAFVGNLSNTLPVGVRFCKMKNSQIRWPHHTPCWFSARFEDGLLNIHSQPQLVAGLIVAAWNSLKGGNVSPATGEMMKAPGPEPCCNSISIFIQKILRKALPLPIFLLLGFFHSSGLLAVFNDDVNGICFH